MSASRIPYLLQQYLARQASAEEQEELFALVRSTKDDDLLRESLAQSWMDFTTNDEISLEQADMIFHSILRQAEGLYHQPAKILSMHVWKRIAAAAIIIILGTGMYLFLNRTSREQVAVNPYKTNQDVAAPKSVHAVITLASGKQIVLDSADKGTLAVQGKVRVSKLADGQISYAGAEGDLSYNTLTNPRGSQPIHITLSDGTAVWLNAESSLRYPVAFTGSERKVTVTGEAYFEVTHSTRAPFWVQKGDLLVSVLGTHFNVNAYDDESTIKVTLLEGSVKVAQGNASDLLRPGQQAQISKGIRVVDNTDIGEVMAWKNGLFKFNQTDIETVMRQIGRWYDVQVTYPNGIPKDVYWGGIPRTQSLANVFKILEESGAHFKIEGKQVIVLP